MKKGGQSAKPARREPDVRELETRIEALQMELAQKDLLLTQGFEAFTQAAEKLQESNKRLQQEVAERNQALERNLQEKERVKTYLSNIFESLAIGVLVTDLEGGVTSINRTGQQMLGLPAGEVAGHSVNDLLGAELVGQAAGGPRRTEPFDADEPLTFTNSDGTTRKLQISVTQMRGEQETPLGYILNVQDVTLLKKLEEHAERRNRFTAMGEMAANIAHEIRNPLGSIELFTSLVKKTLADEDERTTLMNHISSGVASMNHIISNLLAYTKPRPVSWEELDLHELLREAVGFFQFVAEKNEVEVALRLEAGRSWIRGGSEQLKQVVHNLFLNAVQAMPDGGTLTIATRTLTITNPKLLARFAGTGQPAETPRDVIEVSFRDTGMGMPRDTQKQIFDPFFTTKSRGTGLGLAIVHNLVESHHATIDVESRSNQGTTFYVMFPLIA